MNESDAQFLADVEALSAFNQNELSQLATHVESKYYDFGDDIIKAGDICDGLYIVKSGRTRLFITEKGKDKSIGIRKAGETFGEIAILQQRPADFSVRASAKSEVLFIPSDAIEALSDKNKTARGFINRYVALKVSGGFVTQLFNLRQKATREEIEELIQSIGIKRVKSGQHILEQEAADDRRLYIIREGQINIVLKEASSEYTVRVLGRGEIFGEKACLLYSVQPASAIADRDSIVMVVPQKTVHSIIERNPDIRVVLEERIQFEESELERQKKLAAHRGKRILFDAKSESKMGERLIKRFPLVEQAEEMDCGAACLAMICKNYKIPMTLGKLREMANVTTEGATMESLSKVGESLGFTTKGVRCTYNSLLDFELPFIAHWEGYHYIVIYGVSKNRVHVADPGAGFKKMSVSEFDQGWTGNCLLFTPTVDLGQMAVKSTPWKRFIGYLTPFKSILRDLFLASIIIQLLGLASPIIIQHIVDGVVVHQNHHLLNMMMMGLFITMVFSQITGFVSGYLSNFMIRKLDFNMMSNFYKHLLALPLRYFTTRNTGDIMARFGENETIRRFMTETSISTILNAIMVFIYFGVMFVYNVKLTLILMAFLPPIIIITLIATPKYKSYARKAFYAEAAAESLLVETLGGAETVKGMGIERSMRMKWEKKYADSLDINFRSEIFTSIVENASEFFKSGSSLVLLWIGANMVLTQELTIGQLMAFNSLIGSVMSPVMGLVGVWDEFQETLVSMERLGDVLEMEPEQRPENIASRVILPDLKGDIRFEDVYFRYGGRETPYVLENINLEIESGTTVALVGPSGSGKTTLAKMLVGFYLPTEGRIYVDGHEMSALDLEYYRSQVGYVMQSNLLFSGTVAENIAIGDINQDMPRIHQVAKLADAHGFISNMQLGYQQVVGERGAGISGGQIQRICIARALYHDPKFLTFDEATSALDAETESNIQRSMLTILEGRTAVIIAHRLSTVMNADRILVLYDGGIAEAGTHQELLEKRGMYFHLVQKQVSVNKLN
jgi:ATP-binding cassette subfamily B protein